MENPYAEILRVLTKKRVRYVVIGVFGINFYVTDPGEIFSTQDCDLLVKPEPDNLVRVLKLLESKGFQLETNGEPLIGVDRWLAQKIIEHRAMVIARKDRMLRIDIVIEGGKIPYEKWNRHKKVFTIAGSKVSVGSLPMLIRAKENSNREKDRAFLKLYKIQLKEILKKQ